MTPCQVVVALLLALLGVAAQACDGPCMVFASGGDLPLIMTVPHDGAEALGVLAVRTTGTVLRDAHTRELAERVAVLLEQRTGKRPYLVVARFSRKYLDANRPETEAMESPQALPAYRAGALLVDVHGQSQEPATTFRGTRAGLTARALLRRFGPSALADDLSDALLIFLRHVAWLPP